MVKVAGSQTDIKDKNKRPIKIHDVVRWGNAPGREYILVEDDESILLWIEKRAWCMKVVGDIYNNPELLGLTKNWKE